MFNKFKERRELTVPALKNQRGERSMYTQKNLSMKKMLGYSMGALGDNASYCLVFNFLSFFFTTIAGVSPRVSGIIISIALVWDAITDPICGIMMDRSRCKYGKRRPFILTSLPVLGASMILLFLNVDFPQAQKNIYYMVLVCVFWLAYTVFNIPYYSLGGGDYGGRWGTDQNIGDTADNRNNRRFLRKQSSNIARGHTR